MALEINDLLGPPLSGAGEGNKVAPNGQRPSAAESTTVAPRGDQVSLTDSATRLRELENEVSQLPVVDAQRVAEVQRSLSIGTYQINPSDVADKMLSIEKAMS